MSYNQLTFNHIKNITQANYVCYWSYQIVLLTSLCHYDVITGMHDIHCYLQEFDMGGGYRQMFGGCKHAKSASLHTTNIEKRFH